MSIATLMAYAPKRDYRAEATDALREVERLRKKNDELADKLERQQRQTRTKHELMMDARRRRESVKGIYLSTLTQNKRLAKEGAEMSARITELVKDANKAEAERSQLGEMLEEARLIASMLSIDEQGPVAVVDAKKLRELILAIGAWPVG